MYNVIYKLSGTDVTILSITQHSCDAVDFLKKYITEKVKEVNNCKESDIDSYRVANTKNDECSLTGKSSGLYFFENENRYTTFHKTVDVTPGRIYGSYVNENTTVEHYGISVGKSMQKSTRLTVAHSDETINELKTLFNKRSCAQVTNAPAVSTQVTSVHNDLLNQLQSAINKKRQYICISENTESEYSEDSENSEDEVSEVEKTTQVSVDTDTVVIASDGSTFMKVNVEVGTEDEIAPLLTKSDKLYATREKIDSEATGVRHTEYARSDSEESTGDNLNRYINLRMRRKFKTL